MKTIKLELTLTLCAIVALCGCVKDRQNVKSTAESADGSRVIAVSFCPSTKTIIDNDGLTPKFQEGDAILVANGKAFAECKVVIENDIAVIHTDLEGELDAVYPASAAEHDGCTIYGIRVAPTQTGIFADANICRAKIAANSNSATFSNQTAVLKFYVDATIGVQSITIDSSDSIATDSGSILIDFNDKSSILSDIGNSSSNERICYVAAKARTYTDLHFSSKTSTQASTVTKELTKVTLEAGKMYNVFLPYYIQVGDQKWGYCNVGAFLPEEPGYYFSWGNTQGYIRHYDPATETTDWTLPSGQPAPAGGFTQDNYSTTSGATLTSDITAENDAATLAWGGEWRMPSASEFESLAALSSEWITIINSKQKGRKFGNVFFPAVGRGYNTSLDYQNKKASYWSSTFNPENPAFLYFDSSDVEVSNVGRYQGMPIRPIYGDPAPDIPIDALPGEFTVAVDTTGRGLPPTKIHFSKGNLQATYNGSDYTWGFAEHQYDYIGYDSGNISIDSPKTGDVVDLFCWVGTSSSFTGAAQYGITTAENYSDYSSSVNDELKSDWGKTIDDKGTWRTLSKNEWDYLLQTRDMPNNGARYQNAANSGVTLNDEKGQSVTKYGIVLFPDGFANQSSWVQAYKTWEEFSQNGLVFLPAAGRKSGDDIDYYGKGGQNHYWTSTHSSDKESWAWYIWNPSDEFNSDQYICNLGCSVRLVTNK